MLKNKTIVVTGGTGMIGRELVKLLKDDNDVLTLSLDKKGIDGIHHLQMDLTDKSKLKTVIKKGDILFHLAGIKGSPDAAINRPASFFVPMLQFNTNLMQHAFEVDCDHFLYTSSVGVYGPAEVFNEEDTETTMPSKNDWYAGWAKRVGEMQAAAYQKQYDWKKYSIIRPANVYGAHDNFDIKNAMVIPTLIHKMVSMPDEPLELHGDGSNVRDFVYAADVARAMVYMVENKLNGPMNIGSGTGVTIKEIVETLRDIIGFEGKIVWKGGPSGDKKRLMNMSKLFGQGFNLKYSLEDGLSRTVAWYVANSNKIHERVNYFAR